jgi:putative transposase
MARQTRLAMGGHAHYVRQTCVSGQALTLDADDVRLLMSALQALSAQYPVAIWAYAVLREELQLLLCPAEAEHLGRFMQALGRRYVPAFNRRHARQGALWGARFRAAMIEPGEWVLASMLRIDSLAQACGGPGSAAHHAGERRDPLLSDPPELWSLGNTPFERELEWRRRLHVGQAPGVEATLARAVQGAWVVGSPAFAAEVAGLLDRPAQPRSPGRPRRTPPT